MTGKAQNQGPEVGHCQICQRFGKLTKDHVPPKGCPIPKGVQLRTFIGHFDGLRQHPRLMQHGSHFRSLCDYCNNVLLGSNYDPGLIGLASQVHMLFTSKIALPTSFHIPVQTRRLAKSVVGHMLAGYVPNNSDLGLLSAPKQDAMRAYVLDADTAMPSDLELYYWPYRGSLQLLVNAIGVCSLKAPHPWNPIIGSFLKFFPLGFWLVHKRPAEARIPFTRILDAGNLPLDHVEELLISPRNNPAWDWPERPAPDQFMLLNEEVAFVSALRGQLNPPPPGVGV